MLLFAVLCETVVDKYKQQLVPNSSCWGSEDDTWSKTLLSIKEITAAYSRILTYVYLRMDLSLEDWIWVEILSKQSGCENTEFGFDPLKLQKQP